MNISPIFAALTVFLFAQSTSQAEIVSSSNDHFKLEMQAKSTLSSKEVWDRLIAPSEWWHADHTYSGDAKNLTLNLTAGGLWREDWASGSVAHGRVLLAEPPRLLRLDAPFGPLQELAVESVWTITIAPDEAGSIVKFEFVANGSTQSDLEALAPTVDFVKSEALKNLVALRER